VAEHPALNGIRHVAAEPISKFDLIQMLKDAYNMPVEILPDDEVVCDRSLDGTRFEQETGLRAQPWPEMIAELVSDKIPYEQLRTGRC
jgi:dTDP-4-dehydrorhamnose reductase